MNSTINNTLNHKCPYCGYTTEFDCWRKNDKGELVGRLTKKQYYIIYALLFISG